MIPVGEPEIKTQRRVIALFNDRLCYRCLRNWHEEDGNKNIERHLLEHFLTRQSHPPAVITKTIERLPGSATNRARALPVRTRCERSRPSPETPT